MAFFPTRRLFTQLTNRAIVYSQSGDPSKVISSFRYPQLSPPASNTVNIEFLLAPINPADINVIEGVYPSKPREEITLAASGKGSPEHPVYVCGNEGLARVTAVGSGVSELNLDDWVVMTRPQSGTWCTSRNVCTSDIIKVPRKHGLSQVHAATMTVNPPTAYNMLQDFVSLREGDWVVQNGANSAVGQAVIQIAASRGLKTLNFVRNRHDIQKLVEDLQSLGATRVLTYDELSDKSLRAKLKEWTGGRDISLGLNCVGGNETALMARLLGNDAHLISYGAMSKQPLSFPTSLFIFKNLTSHGFWQTRWYQNQSQEKQGEVMRILVDLMATGRLQEPRHEVLTITAHESDSEAEVKIRDTIMKMTGGQQGKKVLLKLESLE